MGLRFNILSVYFYPSISFLINVLKNIALSNDKIISPQNCKNWNTKVISNYGENT